MKRTGCEDWDQGRLQVNAQFADILKSHGLTTFQSWMNFDRGTVAKHLLRERPTVRLELGQQAFYLKRHYPAPWREYLKPLIRLRWPRLGARYEWLALWEFQRLGIPSLTPVAVGTSGRCSFLVTAALEGCTKLSDWLRTNSQGARLPAEIVQQVAELARTMHTNGLHHQDFYAGHLMLPQAEGRPVHVIDLGRVAPHASWNTFWVIKDLAQLHFSTPQVRAADRLRFLRRYLGRPLRKTDRRLMRQVLSKAASIARHTRKHGWE